MAHRENGTSLCYFQFCVECLGFFSWRKLAHCWPSVAMKNPFSKMFHYGTNLNTCGKPTALDNVTDICYYYCRYIRYNESILGRNAPRASSIPAASGRERAIGAESGRPPVPTVSSVKVSLSSFIARPATFKAILKTRLTFMNYPFLIAADRLKFQVFKAKLNSSIWLTL